MTDREYNQHHQIIRETSNTGVVTQIGRDEYGTVTRIDYGDGTTETITPGAWGEPAQITGRDGLITEYEVDAAGMVTAVTDPLGVVTRFEYDWRQPVSYQRPQSHPTDSPTRQNAITPVGLSRPRIPQVEGHRSRGMCVGW